MNKSDQRLLILTVLDRVRDCLKKEGTQWVIQPDDLLLCLDEKEKKILDKFIKEF